jgi:methionyl-tRNA synthetase
MMSDSETNLPGPSEGRPVEPAAPAVGGHAGEAKKAEEEKKADEVEKAKEAENLISVDAFARVDLRVAKVLQVEPHPNADRLLTLQIDLGDERRQLVAGLAAHYRPEELIGKQIIVVANLEPAKLRGEVSQGMLLAASDEEGVSILVPERPMAPGSRVR